MRIDQLTDSARVWIFGASEELSSCSVEAISQEAQRFLATWSSHGSALRAAAEIQDGTLLIVALEEGADASGCSVDKLFRFAQQRRLLDSGRIYYRQGSAIRSATRDEFRKLVDHGQINDDTVVIDTTVEHLGDIRHGTWQRRFADSWHATTFRPHTTV
jgi:hypothetical protein